MSRIFQNCSEAYKEVKRDLREVGQLITGGHTVQDKNVEGNPEYEFYELSPYVYSITGDPRVEDFIKELNLNRTWIEIEFIERVNGVWRNPGIAWTHRQEIWGEFLESNGRFSYTYAERLANYGQIKIVIDELSRNPASRQAVLSVWDANVDIKNLGGRHRIPCSMFYQLMVRENRLNLHYIMRSCDVFTHLPYDVVLAIELQKFFARELGLETGQFTHIITSLHAFRKDFGPDVF